MSKDRVRPSPFWFATLSLFYLVAIGGAVVRNWEHMATMTPNEWGDVAAGAFSPLAFLWFLYTALAQRAELRLQHEELQQNTKAQRDQEQQLQRQANALDAQTQRLQAQAAAQYAPILTLRTSGQHDGGTLVQVTNHGAPVLNVVSTNGARIFGITGAAPVRGGVIPHWPSDTDIQFVLGAELGNTGGAAEDRVLEIVLTRLDLQHFQHRYIYSSAHQRLILQQVQPIDTRSI